MPIARLLLAKVLLCEVDKRIPSDVLFFDTVLAMLQ